MLLMPLPVQPEGLPLKKNQTFQLVQTLLNTSSDCLWPFHQDLHLDLKLLLTLLSKPELHSQFLPLTFPHQSLQEDKPFKRQLLEQPCPTMATKRSPPSSTPRTLSSLAKKPTFRLGKMSSNFT